MADQRTWSRRSTQIDVSDLPPIAEKSTPLPFNPSQPSSSTAPTPKKRGRPKSDFAKLSPKGRVSRILDLNYPTGILRTPKPWGVRMIIQTFSLETIEFEFNCYELTALTTYEGRPLPSDQQPPMIKSEKELLSQISHFQSLEICMGNTALTSYLRAKGVSLEEENLLLSRRKDASSEREIIAQIKKITGETIYFYAISCHVVVSAEHEKCNSCKQLQKSIRDKTKFNYTISQQRIHLFAMQMGQNLEVESTKKWTPFLQIYFKELNSRTSPTQPWSAPIIIFSLAMYCKQGARSYHELRQYLPLPSLSTLRALTSKLSTGPGLCKPAIAAFLQREPLASICISFDEIYYTQGLQIIRVKDSFHLIGMTTFGSWEASSQDIQHFLFNFTEETDIHPSFPHTDPPLTNTETTVWCTEEEATSILREEEGRQAKMALHFLISSISTNTTQAIGYVECFSVTSLLLKALLFRIISATALFASQLSVDSASTAPATTFQSSSSDTWSFFHSFADDWSQTQIEQPSLRPQTPKAAPWLSNAAVNPKACARVVAVSFDGSSHARSMVRQISRADSSARFFIHPAQPSQRIYCISDIVHLFKRFRNNILKDQILLAPDISFEDGRFPDVRTHPDVYTGTFNSHLYKELVAVDSSSILSISRLSKASVELTSRSKMSFPLAKNLFAPRTLLTLDVLEQRCRAGSDFTGAYLAYSAKAVATFANQILFRTRSRWILTGEYRLRASQQLFEIWESFQEWQRRNNQLYLYFSQQFPTRTFTVPNTRVAWGFFDTNFMFDFGMTILGLSMLCCTEEAICLRLVTSDCVESFFSTVRATAGGGGQLNARTHRFSTRRAMLVRLHLFSYVGDMIERDQPVIQSILARPPKAVSVLPPYEIQNVPHWENYAASAHEIPVIRYIAGWLLRSLIKNFPENPRFHELLQARVHGLIQSTNEFERMVERLVVFCHLLMSEHRLNLQGREDCQDILQKLMLQHQGDLIRSVLDNAQHAHFLATKVTRLYVADFVKRKRAFYEQSFRNSLR